jgi:hypothetical protein
MIGVKAKLVRLAMCECGAPAVWENVPLGKLYIVYPETAIEKSWTCAKCGKHYKSKMVMVDDGLKPLGYLFLGLFELDEGVAA